MTRPPAGSTCRWRKSASTAKRLAPRIFSRDTQAAASRRGRADNTEVATPLSLLDSRWELSPESKLGTFNIRGYKPVYRAAGLRHQQPERRSRTAPIPTTP